MFQLLGMLIEAGKDISSVKDILTGDQQTNQTATTTLALIEQGQKVFSAIYKRVHRSLKDEFRKLYRLNRLYMEPEEYYRYQDKMEPILLEDYQGDDTDVCPVSDPNLVSDAQQLAQAEALTKFINDPMVKQDEIRRRYFRAIKIEDPEQLLQEPPQAQPQDDPKVVDAIARLEILEKKEAAAIKQSDAKTANIEADTALKLTQADAQAAQLGQMLQPYLDQMKTMLAMIEAKAQDDQGRISELGGAPADGQVSPVLEGQAPGIDGGLGGGEIQPPEPGADGAGEYGSDGAGAVPAGAV